MLHAAKITVAASMLALSVAFAAEVARDPQPGEIYREFAAHQGGDDWRVTNPKVKDARAHQFLPNPRLRLKIGSLEGAVRAEALLDRWSGHISTQRPRIRFNARAWLEVPPPLHPPGQGDHERYYFQDNPVLPVPLEHLQAGDNTFEGICSHENEAGWGQWGLYSLILRVYYKPAAVPHASGRILSPVDAETLGENPTVRLEASSPSGVSRIDVLAWYEGFDENGDGVWLDWHGGYFQPVRGDPADLRDHVGTLWRSPYELAWDTRWMPDQKPGSIKLIARVQDSRGAWFVTQPVTGLTLQRRGESVRLYRTAEVPERFGVRNHSTKSCRILIPAEHDLSRAMEAGLHYRTWHAWDGHHHPFQLNDLVRLNEGKNHHYDYDIHLIPPSALKSGDNVFTIRSDTEHHMLEVHWPGPALTVRFRTEAER